MYNIYECDFMKKAGLKKRVIAYLIDMLIVSLIISIISSGFSTSSRIEKLNNELNDVVNSYVSSEITSDEYLNSVADIGYDINKINMVSNTLYVVICVGYFILFQYLNDGASIGKKIMGIRIVNNKGKEANLINFIIRTSIVDNILPTLLCVILLYVFSGTRYFFLVSGINFIRFIFVIVSLFMIRFRDDNLALNDIMSYSVVIEDK